MRELTPWEGTALAYTGSMMKWSMMTKWSAPERGPPWDGSTASLSAAAYITCAALSVEPVLRALQGQIPLTGATLCGAAGLLAVPILFALAHGRPRSEPRSTLSTMYMLLQAPAALLACWGLSDTILPALLAIVAGQFAGAYRLRTTLWLLLPVNVALVLVLPARLDPIDVLTCVLGYGSFQAFAVLAIRYVKDAQLARDEVLRVNAELLATRQLLLEGARDEERLRVSRELHDLVGHKLTALTLQLRLRARKDAVESGGSDDVCVRLSEELLSDVRGVVSTLRDSDGIDLHQALAALIPAVPRPTIELDLASNARVPRLQQAHALLRCAQEGLTNALRHSGASRIILRLANSADGVALSIEDDGAARSVPHRRNGLTGMQERLQALGGTLEVAVIGEHGLRVTAWLPQPDAELGA